MLSIRGLILHRMLSEDTFEASCLLLSHYLQRVSNNFNWKTTYYSWLKQLLIPLPPPFHLYGGNSLPPQLTATALFQHINPCNFSRSLMISVKFSKNVTNPHRIWIICKKCIATGRLDKVFVDCVTPNPTWIMLLLLWYLFILNFMNVWGQTWYLLFCKMIINKKSWWQYPYLTEVTHTNSMHQSIVDSTSHYDVKAPSTVSTMQNAKLLTSRNLCHFFMLCHVTRSQCMWECETLRRPTWISRAIEAAQKSTQL